MNHDILRSIKDRDDLHKTVMSTPPEDPSYDSLKEILQNLKSSLKKKIRYAKAKYYADVFEKNKSNIRHSWGAIKEILGKFKNKHDFPDYFTLDGKLISEPQLITNCFNRFFSSVGRALSETISYNGTNSVSSYLKRHVSSCFHFECVNPTIVMKYINDLASKSSSGPDKISSILLKRLANYIVTPLTVMINQSLCTGTFPDKLKLVKVIPLYKKVDNHVFDNYRPISLLSTVSKIFEKVVFIQVYDYFCAHQLFLWKPVWLQKMPFNGTCCVRTSWSFIQTPWWWKNPSLSFPWLIKGFWYPESCHINGQVKVLWSEWNFLKLVSFILAW